MPESSSVDDPSATDAAAVPEKAPSTPPSSAADATSAKGADRTVDPAFAGIKPNVAGFYVWRVEQLQIKPVPEAEWGRFHRGDSYLVFSAAIPSPGARMEVHLHFWLGSETSQDEAGVAAYKTVELDDYLGGAPIQHREVEGRESQRFRAYFRSGITFLEGGVASGLHHVSGEHVPKMYLVKGKRQPIVRQLPSVEWKHVNDGDVFVVDAKGYIFVWTGASANNQEKIQSARLASRIKDQHGGGSVVIVESGKENELTAEEKDALDVLLPLSKRRVAPAEPDCADERQDRRFVEQLRLYRCSDAEGSLQVTEVKRGPLLQSDLVEDDSFIVDNGDQGIWVWVGKKATKQERAEAMVNAQGFIQKKGYPTHTPVSRVIDGGEPAEFRSLFREWRDKNSTVGLGRQHSRGTIAKPPAPAKFDAATLHVERKRAAESGLVDDGTGKREVWRVEDHGKLVEVPQSQYGRFFGGDCYIIQYSYRAGGRDHWIIYYWLGAHSSQDERGNAALKAVELDDALGGRPVQVRVVQGKEPPHFLALFGGRMIVYAGGKASAFDGPDGKDQSLGDTYLLHVRGTSALNTRAIQVACRASSLNSNDCFVLVEPGSVTVWYGKGSTEEERKVALNIAAEVVTEGDTNDNSTDDKSEKVQKLTEGEENEDFWSALGGKGEYANSPRLAAEPNRPARLFQCSTASGSFSVTEIMEFEQQDLCSDDVMLLDAWDAIWVWIGGGSTREERQQSEQTAVEYLRTDPAGRGTGTPILRVRQGGEPPSFTGFFGAWLTSMWASQPSWDTVCRQVADDNKVTVEQIKPKEGQVFYPPDKLRKKDVKDLPDDVDTTRKEDYLTEDDFTKVFGMTRPQYLRLPQWKKVLKKKEVGMF